jgi:ATP-dependent DNA ligase
VGGDYAFEVKWDGFRALVSTEGPLRFAAAAAGI